MWLSETFPKTENRMKQNLIKFAIGVALALGGYFLWAAQQTDCNGVDVPRHCVEN
jgi:hypothetical protein